MALSLQGVNLFVHGKNLEIITIASIYFGALAMLFHAFYSFGWRYSILYLSLTLAFALATEQIGIATGWPFGNHTFNATLGLRIYDVPLVIPFIWVMLAHPILVAARRITQHWVFLYGGIVLAGWHLFIDSQLSSNHQVIWSFADTPLPFEKEIPVSSPVGWLFIGMLLFALLHVVLPRERRKQGAEYTVVDVFLFWILISGIAENYFFFNQPSFAIFSGAFLALVLAPYFFSRWLGQPAI